MQQLSFPALPQSVRLVCSPWLRTYPGFCFCLFLPLILAAVGAVFLEEETHLFMSFVYCYCLPSIQILPFNFLWFQFPFLAFLPFIPALVFSSQDCIHDWHMLLPLSAHKARGPDYLSASLGAVFMVSYCISVHSSSVTCTSGYQWVHLLSALSPCPATSLSGDTEGTSTVLLFLNCLFVCGQLLICIMYIDFEIFLG